MAVSGAHIYFPGQVADDGTITAQTSTWYDLRTVIGATNATSRGSTAMVQVRLRGMPHDTTIVWPKTEFEAAKVTSLAATGG